MQITSRVTCPSSTSLILTGRMPITTQRARTRAGFAGPTGLQPRRPRGGGRGRACPPPASLSVVANDAAVDYRALLEEEQHSLEQQLREIGFGDDGNLEYDSNFADSSQVTAERGEAEALAAQLRERSATCGWLSRSSTAAPTASASGAARRSRRRASKPSRRARTASTAHPVRR